MGKIRIQTEVIYTPVRAPVSVQEREGKRERPDSNYCKCSEGGASGHEPCGTHYVGLRDSQGLRRHSSSVDVEPTRGTEDENPPTQD